MSLHSLAAGLSNLSVSPSVTHLPQATILHATPSYIIPALLTIIIVCNFYKGRGKQGKRIPGPRALPLLGNLLDWPSHHQGERMEVWQKVYGPITRLSILGKNVLFLTSTNIISELFVKRSAVFSDRPQLVFSQELCGMDVLHPMTQYGADFREQRKFMKEALAPEVQRRHESLLNEEGRRLLRATYEDPEDTARHLRRFSTSFSLRMVYGLPALEVDDPQVLLAEEMMALSEYALTGGWLVDFLPILKHLPSWVPFHRRARYFRAKINEMMSKPWGEVKEQVHAGTAPDSFCSINMQKFDDGKSKHTETLIKATAAAIYGAGADTSAASSYSFVLAMLLHPSVQSRAQDELDDVVGRDRLPCLADRPKLPYLTRVLWEVLRWAPPVPVAIPHRNREAVEFDGYMIPKDTMLMASIFSLSRDPEVYASPETFNPDRFEGERGERLPHHAFGVGPRRCPGADVAFTQLFLQAAYILACFRISPQRDVAGKEIIPEVKFGGGMVRNAEEFPFVMQARWDGVERLFSDA
ncbi:Cytochrome P450 [Mycena indigotica]|uniref:Cytochrome P450 n=1 Tax=Mycena indigotica TaxID=2126181 RepID=A0A8H6T1H9_9AGAR|nr:Cytochrome P450 [Mycena indigotica]KAF7309278.1 Cytochrome P450 [Mycena indigotica]